MFLGAMIWDSDPPGPRVKYSVRVPPAYTRLGPRTASTVVQARHTVQRVTHTTQQVLSARLARRPSVLKRENGISCRRSEPNRTRNSPLCAPSASVRVLFGNVVQPSSPSALPHLGPARLPFMPLSQNTRGTHALTSLRSSPPVARTLFPSLSLPRPLPLPLPLPLHPPRAPRPLLSSPSACLLFRCFGIFSTACLHCLHSPRRLLSRALPHVLALRFLPALRVALCTFPLPFPYHPTDWAGRLAARESANKGHGHHDFRCWPNEGAGTRTGVATPLFFVHVPPRRNGSAQVMFCLNILNMFCSTSTLCPCGSHARRNIPLKSHHEQVSVCLR